jgi:ubiquinone/menaquinone biosynthesis C-methylase UbiE
VSRLGNTQKTQSFSDGEPFAGIQHNVNTHFDANVAYWDEVYGGDELQGVIYQQRQAAVLRCIDEAQLVPGARVLEIGCGAGHLTRELGRRELIVHAVDASPAMAEIAGNSIRAHSLEESVTVAVADVHGLPFSPGTFDLVVAVGVLPWLHSPADAVGEMARVLKPQGQVVLTADNAARLSSFTDPRAMVALTPLRHLYHALRRKPGDAVSYLHSPRRIDGLLRGAGLEPAARATCGFGPFSFFGAPIMGDRAGIRVNERVQRLADRGFPGLKWTGWHYVVRAARRGPRAGAASAPAEQGG